MIKDYLEISRLFNMGLTGVAPVLGALSMWLIQEITLIHLFILFCIGCFSHVYGFVLNDIKDTAVDKLSNELFARPLVSGSISRKKATIFAISCMILSFIVSIVFFRDILSYIYLVSILLIAYILATIYNFASKKYPGMDFFVAGAVFFLILFGAATVSIQHFWSNYLIWIVASIGAVQVLFMNMINGAIKDIDHDKQGSANTLAIWLGAQTYKGKITLPTSFKAVGYLVEIVRSVLIFIPFFILPFFSRQLNNPFVLLRIGLLIFLTVIILFSISKLFSIQKFNRTYIRKWIGIIVIVMYATTPIMLSTINVFFAFIAFIPPLWFIISNIALHGTILEPKTM
ncbi:MAG: UbiA family prenyltransferase [Thermoplasmatota archaeon]